MNGLNTHADLNILPLGSYDLLIGMYYLEKHRVTIIIKHSHVWMIKVMPLLTPKIIHLDL